MPQDTSSATQVPIILMANVAVAAILATMLVRFHSFRRILLTEKRDWPERLLFAVWFGIPLVAGVGARLLLHYDAADLTLPGAFLAGLIAGPYAGALVGLGVGLPAIFGGELGALPFAVGCGFAGGGLREICPKDEIWRFSPFFLGKLHRSAWRLMRRLELVQGEREAVRRGAALFALPHHAADGARAIWHTADTIWTALGDESRDFNWYTKRTTLSAVYSSALLYWLGDQSPGASATREFIGRRIDDVMRIEDVKAKMRANPIAAALMKGPQAILDRVRPPGDTRPSDLPGSWRRRD